MVGLQDVESFRDLRVHVFLLPRLPGVAVRSFPPLISSVVLATSLSLAVHFKGQLTGNFKGCRLSLREEGYGLQVFLSCFAERSNNSSSFTLAASYKEST